MNKFLLLIGEPTECSVGSACLNSVSVRGKHQSRCADCRFAPNNDNVTGQHWRPATKGQQHPTAFREKRQKAQEATRKKIVARQGKDRKRQVVLKRATRSEKTTEKNIITATKNSGRSFQDGDHVAGGLITLDTKDQSQLEHPVVRMHELSKVGRDARRAGMLMGGLVLRNKHGVGVVCLAEDDFAYILKRLTAERAMPTDASQ